MTIPPTSPSLTARDMLSFIDKSPPEDRQLVANILSALRMYDGHPEPLFTDLTAGIRWEAFPILSRVVGWDAYPVDLREPGRDGHFRDHLTFAIKALDAIRLRVERPLVLHEIERFAILAPAKEVKWLADVLLALRGPDTESFSVKKRTTMVVRGVVLPHFSGQVGWDYRQNVTGDDVAAVLDDPDCSNVTAAAVTSILAMCTDPLPAGGSGGRSDAEPSMTTPSVSSPLSQGDTTMTTTTTPTPQSLVGYYFLRVGSDSTISRATYGKVESDFGGGTYGLRTHHWSTGKERSVTIVSVTEAQDFFFFKTEKGVRRAMKKLARGVSPFTEPSLGASSER